MIELVLDGPGKNSLGTPMILSIIERVAAADGRPILLTGAGDALSAGLDLKEIASLDRDQMAGFLQRLETMCRMLYQYPGPVVALVNGHAIAGGCVLTLCADFRVMTDNPKAKIGLNEVALGLRFPPGILRIVRGRIPEASQSRVLLGAALMDPAAALRLGLVDELSGDPRTVAVAALEALARHPAAAYAATKHDLRRFEISAEEELRFESEVVPTWTSSELKQRILAVLKR